MKKILYLLSIVFVLFFAVGCKKSDKVFDFLSEEIIIELGEHLDVPIDLHGEKFDSLSFVFSNEDIVQISNNQLFALNYGETEMTVFLNKDASSAKSITVRVPLKFTNKVDLLEVGKNIRLQIQDFTDRSLFDWEIANTEILSMDANYNIKALKPGKTFVTVTNKTNPIIKGVYRVSVPLELFAPTNKVGVNGKIALSVKDLALADAESNTEFTWIVSDSNIISIDENNYITGITAGTANITAYKTSNPDVTGTMEIIVGGAEIVAIYLDAPITPESMIHAGELGFAKIHGVTNNELFEWHSLNPNILAVSEKGRITALLAGTGTIAAKLKSDNTVFGTITISVFGEPNVDYASRLLSMAHEELGYKEGSDGYSKFGAWYSSGSAFTYGHWCAMFVSWCAYQAGISTDIIPKYASVSIGQEWYIERGLFKYKADYTPKKGDIIFFTSDGASHTGIVVYSDETKVYTIEGNTSDTVAYRNYSFAHSKITGYGTPDYPPFSVEGEGPDFNPDDSNDGGGESTT